MKSKILKLVFISLLVSFSVQAQEKIDINTASREQLETLTGIGPVYAQRIIEARPFSSIDELIEIKGIGEKTLQKIKDQELAYASIPRPEPTLNETEEIQEILEYPKNIIFVKIMPSPKGSDEKNEYFEIKNTNNFEVDLANWEIRDKEGSTNSYILNQKIKAFETLILKRPETKIVLNNSGDGLELLDPNKEIVDSVSFEKAQTGIAFLKTTNGWQWEEIKKQAKALSQETVPEKSTIQEKKETIINLSKEESKLSVFLTAFLVAFFSSIFFIVFKRKLDREQNSIV